MTPNKTVVGFNLQLFADEAATSTGDNNPAPPVADAGDNSSGAAPPAADNATGVNTSGTEISSEDKTPARLSFEKLMENEETAKEAKEYVNRIFSERFGERIKSQEETNAKMKEILDFQNYRYGLDPDSDTYLDDLSEKVRNDAKLFENEALAAGMDVDTYLKVKEANNIIERNKRDSAERERREIINNHIANLRQQSEELKAKVPNFDLERELQNRHFKSLVDPPALGGSGIPVENAYYAIHYQEIQKNVASQAVNQAQTAIANSMAVNKSRPSENVNAKTGATVPAKSFKDLKKEDFEKIRAEFERSGISPF